MDTSQRFRWWCETYKARRAPLAKNHCPFADRRSASLLVANRALSKVLAHLCVASTLSSSYAQVRGGSVQAAFDFGGSKMLSTPKKVGYLSSYDTPRRRIERAP